MTTLDEVMEEFYAGYPAFRNSPYVMNIFLNEGDNNLKDIGRHGVFVKGRYLSPGLRNHRIIDNWIQENTS